VIKYHVEVSAGIMPTNHQIVYLSLLPNLVDTDLTQSFKTSTNDQMLVVYLSSLLRAGENNIFTVESCAENPNSAKQSQRSHEAVWQNESDCDVTFISHESVVTMLSFFLYAPTSTQ